MSDLLDSPVLVLTDLDDAGAPAPGALELLTTASHLTGSGVIALALADVGPRARAALAGVAMKAVVARAPTTAVDKAVDRIFMVFLQVGKSKQEPRNKDLMNCW